ncbi:YodC family protein [Phytobacter diazotrophicus]|uniref:YodC family protein n=1 Tax=Phytobacter diazotrophicus TaxID=395631 RepID=UPI002FFC0C93
MAKAPTQNPTTKYSKGDQVVLKSGGPVMTVEKALTGNTTGVFTGNYRCQWFAGKKLDSGIFPEESLDQFTPKP